VRITGFVLFFLCASLQAQQPAGMHRVGVLFPAPNVAWEAFPQTLKELGYTEGVNLVLDVKTAGARLDLLPALAAEMVKASPRVIVAVNTPGTAAAMAATRTIPIVMVAVGDPIASGFASNLARPDRNATGVSNLCGELAGKRLSLFKEALPRAQRIAVMLNPADPITAQQVKDVERTAPTLGVEIRVLPVRGDAEVDTAFAHMQKWRPDGIFWLCGQQVPLTLRTLSNASRHRIPVMVAQTGEVPAGGLMAYATDTGDLYRRAAIYVDKILKGASVRDLPVEQPTKFDLVINKKIAASLGLVIPPSILLRADRVIE
jgi:putative ABC transport system substrate-binding protein